MAAWNRRIAGAILAALLRGASMAVDWMIRYGR